MSGPIVLGYDGTDGARAALHELARIAPLLGATVVVAFGYEAVAARRRGRAISPRPCTSAASRSRPRRSRSSRTPA